MKAIKIIFLVILSFLLIVVGWSYLLGMSLEKTVFTLSYYEELLEQEEIDLEKIISGIIEEIDLDMEDEPVEEYGDVMIPEMDRLLSNIMNDALKETIEVSWVEEQILLIIEDMLNLARGETDTLTVVIELDHFQEEFMKNMEQRVRVVTEEELVEAGVPEDNVEQVKEMFVEEFAAMTEDVPEKNGEAPQLPLEIDLGQMMQEGELSPELEETLSKVQMFHVFFPVLHYIVFAVLLLLICLLAGLWGGLKWFGASLLITGITFLSGATFIRSLVLMPLLVEAGEELPFGFDVIRVAVNHTLSMMYIPSLVFGVVGLIVLVGAVIIGKRVGSKV